MRGSTGADRLALALSASAEQPSKSWILTAVRTHSLLVPLELKGELGMMGQPGRGGFPDRDNVGLA